jgi:2-polyprenyl-3-methyl-5-hydroxy-6-metoxy-1,4-benzoquinol methylase
MLVQDRGVDDHQHHQHTAEELRDRWTAESWDQRYREKPALWSGHVNAAVEEEVAGLPPGTALDLPCGEGGDALWLAEHGWQVEGADVSPVALGRAAAQASARGLEGSIIWSVRDVLTWQPPAPAYDLVSVTFLHLTPDIRPQVHRALASAVLPGGSFLVVAHHPSDLETTVGRPPEVELFCTPEQVAGDLGEGWTVASARVRPKTARDAEGREVTVHDTVLRAVRGG